MKESTTRAIIAITAIGKDATRINYSRRMYAIIRRYTPEVIEAKRNVCVAELTGLRTFFKMSYQEMIASIMKDLRSEIGISFTVCITDAKQFDQFKKKTKSTKTITTYEEMNQLFSGKSYIASEKRRALASYKPKKVRLTIPFIGKVA